MSAAHPIDPVEYVEFLRHAVGLSAQSAHCALRDVQRMAELLAADNSRAAELAGAILRRTASVLTLNALSDYPRRDDA